MDSLSPYLSAIVGLLIAVTLFSYYLLRRSRIGLAKTAPILAGAWPIIGHLPILALQKHDLFQPTFSKDSLKMVETNTNKLVLIKI